MKTTDGSLPKAPIRQTEESLRCRAAGVSVIELMIVLAVMGIVTAIGLPTVMNAIASYRLHSDAAGIANYANVARMKAASQFAPYRINIAIGASSATYDLEKLCGDTNTTTDAACTGPFASFSNPYIELGTQYSATGDTYFSCRPQGVSAFPGDITADATGCPNNLELYFNTRGSPVDGNGNPLSNGGAVLYLRNQNNLVDAVTLSLGGRVTVWNWEPSVAQWTSR